MSSKLQKILQKFILEGKKLDSVQPVVAYYCRMYAVITAVSAKEKNADDKALIASTMGWLEAHKSVKEIDKDAAKAQIETFAVQVFNLADDEDRAGTATKQTVMKFRSATIFFEILKQFGELSADVKEKLKYSQWKCVDIIRALKEGRVPKPGGADEQELQGDSTTDDAPSEDAGAQGHASEAGEMPSEAGSDMPSEAGGEEPHSGESYPADSHSDIPMEHKAEDSMPQYLPYTHPTEPASAPMADDTPHDTTPHTPVSPPSAASAPEPVRRPEPEVRRPAAAASGTPSGPSVPIKSQGKGLDRDAAIKEGETMAKHAQSALRFEDIKSAVDKLKLSLGYLIPRLKDE